MEQNAVPVGAVVAASLALIGAAPGNSVNNRVAEFPRNYPLAFRHFREIVPDELLTIPYIGSLDTAPDDGGVREISMDGQTMLRAFACMPHDCVNETLVVLFTPDQKHVVAQAKVINSNLKTAYVIMGEPSAREQSCLARASQLDLDHRNREC